jgi:hypothetical protein
MCDCVTVCAMATTKNIPVKKASPKKGGISIQAGARLIPVNFVGIDYEAKRPKAIMAIRLGERISNAGEDVEEVIQDLTNFAELVFGEEIGKEVMARMEDPNDDLDLPHLIQLVTALAEAATDLPNMSPLD